MKRIFIRFVLYFIANFSDNIDEVLIIGKSEVTVSQKASLSLLLSIFFFAIFTVLSFVGLFDLVETRFYNPSITKSVSRELEQEARLIQDYIKELDNHFSTSLQNEAVKRSFLPNQSAEDIFERSRLFGTLMESLGGLQSIRFIDAAGRRIHYSTLQSDVLFQDRLSISYRNYDEETEPFLYSDISVSNQDNTKLIWDSSQDRILFSLPFYDSYSTFRGTAVFSLSVRAISDRLLSEGLMKYGEDVSIVSHPGGIVIGMPRTGKDALVNTVSTIWNEGIVTLTPLDSGNGEVSFALISAKTDQGFFVGKVADESLFAFPFAMKIILLVSFFFTTYLIIFLLFNIKQDSATVIQNRLKRLQINLFEEYYERKGDMDWARWSKELEHRREEVRNELKRGIKINPSSRNNLDIDTLIDKSWNEMAAVMNAQSQPQITANIDEDKLSSILNRVLAAAGTPTAAPASEHPQIDKPKDKTESVPVSKNPAKTESSDIEPLEELEELDDAETLTPADEVSESLEELEESLEPLEEADSPVDGEELEELEEVEPLEELEDAEASVPAGELEEVVSPVDDEELEELEELDDADALTPLNEVSESLEELEEVEPLEELEDAEASVPAGDDPNDLKELAVPENVIPVDESVEAPEEIGADGSVEEDPSLSEEDISKLASEIEFGDIDEPSKDLDRPLEIYSPFDNLFVSPAENLEEKNNDASFSKLDEVNPLYDMSLVYKPFQVDMPDNFPELEQIDSDENTEQSVEEVEEIPEENLSMSNDSFSDDVVIEERNGVNYITGFNVNVNAKNVDSDFKELVDSVLKHKEE